MSDFHEKRAFNAGYLVAVANIMHLHHEDVIAEDVLQELSDDRTILFGLDLTDYDLKVLLPLFRTLQRRKQLTLPSQPA